MTREQLARIPRKGAGTVLDEVCARLGVQEPAPAGWPIVLIECELNLEWWRGYYAAIDTKPSETAA